jgi:hypothetical protein
MAGLYCYLRPETFAVIVLVGTAAFHNRLVLLQYIEEHKRVLCFSLFFERSGDKILFGNLVRSLILDCVMPLSHCEIISRGAYFVVVG